MPMRAVREHAGSLTRRLTSLPYNTGGAGDRLDGMVLSPYTLPGQAYSQYNLGLSCAPTRLAPPSSKPNHNPNSIPNPSLALALALTLTLTLPRTLTLTRILSDAASDPDPCS